MIKKVDLPNINEPTPDLIEHILVRYHKTLRSEFPELLTLAHRVETAYAHDPNAPHGLTQALDGFIADLEDHLCKEEAAVFAVLGDKNFARAAMPISELLQDHTRQEATLNKIAAITHGLRLPSYACTSWTRLYAGIGKLIEDLDEHIFLENNVLFPRVQVNI